MRQKNEEEIRFLRKENEEMKRQLTEGKPIHKQQQTYVSKGTQQQERPMTNLTDLQRRHTPCRLRVTMLNHDSIGPPTQSILCEDLEDTHPLITSWEHNYCLHGRVKCVPL